MLATVLGAVDIGYRVSRHRCPVQFLRPAHDALLTMYRRRYGQQGHTVTAEEVLLAWT